MNHKKRKQRAIFNKFYKEYIKCIDVKASEIDVVDKYEWLYIQESSIEYLNWHHSKLPTKHVFWHFKAVFEAMYDKCYYINNYNASENVLDLCLGLQQDLELYIPEIKLGYIL